jgi:hypothetical protein
VVLWYIFPVLVSLGQEKSGNPLRGREKNFVGSLDPISLETLQNKIQSSLFFSLFKKKCSFSNFLGCPSESDSDDERPIF